jgi:hypothetical protein
MHYGTVINTGLTTDIEMLFKNFKKKSLKDLRGKIRFRDDYDYKKELANALEEKYL